MANTEKITKRAVSNRLLTIYIFILFIFILGLTIRIMVQDRWVGFALIFYMTPWPVLSGFSFLGMLYWIKRKQKKAVLIHFFGVIALLFSWFSLNHYNNPKTLTGDYRTMFWNVDRYPLGVKGVIDHVKQKNADFIGLVEAKPKINEDMNLIEATFNNYELHSLKGGMLFLTRGTLLSNQFHRLSDNGRCNVLSVWHREEQFTIILVDINPDPLKSREDAIEQLFLIMEKYNDNLLVMGDFNTPFDSSHFDSYRSNYQHAFSASGSGWIETYPICLPILAIDHIWLSIGIKPKLCRHQSTWFSGHRSIVLEFDL